VLKLIYKIFLLSAFKVDALYIVHLGFEQALAHNIVITWELHRVIFFT
jgi:hypothetical protein